MKREVRVIVWGRKGKHMLCGQENVKWRPGRGGRDERRGARGLSRGPGKRRGTRQRQGCGTGGLAADGLQRYRRGGDQPVLRLQPGQSKGEGLSGIPFGKN